MPSSNLRSHLETSDSHPKERAEASPTARGGSPQRVSSVLVVAAPLDEEFAGLDRLDRDELDDDDPHPGRQRP